jgi:hypothetical protein
MQSVWAIQPQQQPHGMKKELRKWFFKTKSDVRQNCKTNEYQHWVCLFCGAW